MSCVGCCPSVDVPFVDMRALPCGFTPIHQFWIQVLAHMCPFQRAHTLLSRAEPQACLRYGRCRKTIVWGFTAAQTMDAMLLGTTACLFDDYMVPVVCVMCVCARACVRACVRSREGGGGRMLGCVGARVRAQVCLQQRDSAGPVLHRTVSHCDVPHVTESCPVAQ